MSAAFLRWQLEHLVEIAIKNFPKPVHIDGVTAHQVIDGFGIERIS